MRRTFPPPQYKRSEEMWRSYLATFGFSTKQQTSPIGLMSDGQRSRLIFAMLAMQTSGVLLLSLTLTLSLTLSLSQSLTLSLSPTLTLTSGLRAVRLLPQRAAGGARGLRAELRLPRTVPSQVGCRRRPRAGRRVVTSLFSRSRVTVYCLVHVVCGLFGLILSLWLNS